MASGHNAVAARQRVVNIFDGEDEIPLGFAIGAFVGFLFGLVICSACMVARVRDAELEAAELRATVAGERVSDDPHCR